MKIQNFLLFVLITGINAVPPRCAAKDSTAAIAPQLREHIRYLASDELQGRSPGNVGNQKTVNFIAAQFRQAGLEKLDTSYFQQFKVLSSLQLGKNNSATVRLAQPPQKNGKLSNAKKIVWTVSKDFIPLAFTEDSATSAQVVFLGYGISAKELQYDEYEGLDVKGKIVLVLRGAPEANNPHSKFSPFIPLRAKALLARERGAAAVIFINSLSESVSGDSADALPRLKVDRTGNSGILAVQATRKAIQALFPEGKHLDSLEKIIQTTQKPGSFALPGVTMTLSAQLNRIERLTANVIGRLPGTNPAKHGRYIIIGAHCDHLGWGEENSLYAGKEPKIHPGADDNASGTAGMLALVELLRRKPLEQDVVFMAFNGEESGLLGSQYYCKYPKRSLDSCSFMLNMDMVGRLKGNALSVHGTGTSPLWNSLVDSLGGLHGFVISKSADGFGPSDHASFYAKNIPVLFLFTGLHDDYHRPSDTYDKINYEGEEKVIRFAEHIVRTVDNEPQNPIFTKVQANQVQRATGFRVYVGTIPDYNDHPKGMKLSGVREGSPAQKAGLQEGDVMVKFGKSTVKNVYDYTYALSSFKPGDIVEIVVLREKTPGGETEEITARLTLESRK